MTSLPIRISTTDKWSDVEAQGQGASADADRATPEQSPQAVSAVPGGIPSALPWDDEIAFILGRPCFLFIKEAQLFRSLGYSIPKRAEDEQAFFIHRWLNFYFAHGSEWRDRANEDIRSHIARAASDAPNSTGAA